MKPLVPTLTPLLAPLLALSLGTPARAGDEAADAPAAKAAPDTTEVVVSARRRPEKVEDVPAPVSLLRGNELEARKMYQVQDLQQALPNLTAQFMHARQSSLAVRGIGNNVANEGLEGSVAIYLDNVFLGRPGQAVFDLLDVEQIDLLRGPQGTLFGKNATAGVLNISTRAPSFEPQARAEIALGQRRFHQLQAMRSGPMSDTLAYRISAYQTHDNGWLHNLIDGRDLDEINRKGVRGQLLFKPGSDVNVRIIAEHHEEDSSTGTLVPYNYGPLNRGPGSNTPLGTPGSNATTYARWATGLGASQVIVDPYRYEVSLDGPQHAGARQNAVSGELNANVGTHKLTSITAWRDWHFSPSNDIDGTNLKGFLNGYFDATESQFSEEIRLSSPAGGSHDYVAGLFYLSQAVASDNAYMFGPAAPALTLNPANTTLAGHGQADTRSFAAFGQDNIHLAHRIDLSVGLRATHEDKSGQVQQAAAVPAIATTNPFLKAWDSGLLQSTNDSTAYLLSLSAHPSNAMLLYLSRSSAEKSGGFNVNSVASVGSMLGVDAIRLGPERARNTELGIKTLWWDGRVAIDANVFDTKVVGYQANTTQRINDAYINVISNVGDLSSRGIELDMHATPGPGWTVNANGALTDARFDSGSAPTPYETFTATGVNASSGYGKGSISIAGKRVNGAPRQIANASVQYRWQRKGASFNYLVAALAWRSDSYADINNSIYSHLPAYALANFTVGLKRPLGDSRVDVSLWVKNMFDKRYFLGLAPINNAYYGAAGEPRTVGVSARYEF
ncbi:MAG: TonB-dependent receptor [Pseudomonadota bacterium]